MTNLKEVKNRLIENVIALTVSVISRRCSMPVESIQKEGSPLKYAGDVGILISILLELHEILDLTFDMELNLNQVEQKFSSVSAVVEYLLQRIVEEKI